MRGRETGHFAKALREATGAGVKRMRRKRVAQGPRPTPVCKCGALSDPHLCPLPPTNPVSVADMF